MIRLTEKTYEKPMQKFVCTICSVAFWYLFAHGYRFSNTMYAHDALLQIYQDDSAWQIALGRVLQPVLLFLRGGLCNPWLISFCAMLWLSFGVYLVVDLLGVRKLISINMISGVMACNAVLTALNASFLPWADFFMLSLFLAVAGVWLCKKGSWGFMCLGAAAMAAAMGIYQAYISVSIVLVILLLLQEARENAEFKYFIKKAVSYCGTLLAAALLYYLMWQVIRRIFGIWVADSYNGLASLGDYTDMSLFSTIGLAYRKVFYYLAHPDTFVTMTFRGRSLSIVWKYLLGAANLVAAVCLIALLVRRNQGKERKPWQYLLQILLLLVLPAGMNFVCIISKGNDHILTLYAIVMPYVYAVATAEEKDDGSTGGMIKESRIRKGGVWLRCLVCLSVLCMIWTNVVYANQVYLKRELQDRAITSFMTRIVSDMEDVEGYEPGITPVAFCGPFGSSPYLQEMEGFEELLPYGMTKTPLTYTGTEEAFIRYELAVPINYTRVPWDDPAVVGMPSYPSEGSIAYVDGVLVVKISDMDMPDGNP